jgi:hypothetical protein
LQARPRASYGIGDRFERFVLPNDALTQTFFHG